MSDAEPGRAAGLDRLVSYEDIHAAARARLDPQAYAYFASGALTEWTLRENEAAFGRWRFHKRGLSGVEGVDTSTSVLGTPVALPVLVAPTAFHRLADPEGEMATARAVRSAATLMVLSTMSTVSLEEVASTGVPRWFQLYINRDREVTRALVARAEAAGYTALALTVDTPAIGIRYADQRHGFSLPDGMTLANLGRPLPPGRGSALRAFSDGFHPSLTWHDVSWLREITDLPVVAKGVLTAADARRAVDAGCAAVLVSNHGGRQLDGDPATLDVLPDVVDAVGQEVEVYLDGGVRTGPDVAKALALGARCVLLGRPIVWGLAAGGEAGVARVLGIVQEEFADTLLQLGCGSVAELDAGFVRPAAAFS